MPVTVRGSFQRSVHLGRDVYGDGAHDGYVVTGKAREVIGRVADALAAPVAQRAWSVTGPYGGGKSAFALFLSGLLRGDATAGARLAAADAGLAERVEAARGGAFCPVLVVGSREPLVPALLRGLAEGLDAFAAHHAHAGGDRQRVRDELTALADQARASAPDEAAVLDLADRAARAVHGATGGGLLVVVDELGKMLEHAALYPDAADLFVLQRLAERASRAPAGAKPAPMLVFTVLHQAFDRYAGRLGTDQRDEWRKVQGRFEDVAFVAPVGETLRLLAEAVDATPDALPPGAGALPSRLLALAALPAGADPAEVERDLAGALPLHPAVALVVGPLFRRLAQNERSLFAFLASGEAHGFLDVIGRGEPGLYRLDHLYDYLVAGLGAALFSERMERLWAETEATLGALREPDALDVQVVKHVAVLGFAGGMAGLSATADVLAATTGADADAVRQSLDALRDAHALAFRPFGETYHVWQGSAFDLAAALRQAREQLPPRTPLAEMLRRALPPRPVVARRHSYRTGTPRVFSVAYAGADWRSVAAASAARADGQIVYVLAEDDRPASEVVAEAQAAGLGPLTFVAVPDDAGALRESARDLACLDWVRANAPELAGDAVARRELAEQRSAVAAEVERRLAALLQTDADGRNPCVWVRDGEAFRVEGERALQAALSAACDEVFARAPEIWNELLNRRKPSPSAVRGLKLLLAAMVGRPGAARLGIEGTPAEYGLYASVLQATGLHRETADGWAFARPGPEARPGCAAVWDAVADTLRQSAGRPVPVAEIYAALGAPPYGVRPGLIPVFLLAFAVHARDRVAFFENGAFVRELSFETVERLLKSAEKGQGAFAVQYVEADAGRAALLATLAPLVGLPASTDQPLPVVVRLLGRVHELPPVVRTTAGLSATATAVREALQRATDPAGLLFDALPRALGAGSFLAGDGDRQRYADGLGDALRELGGAYDALLGDLGDQVAGAFRLRAGDADGRRHELAARARVLLPAATDLGLKAFLVRAADETLATRAWAESLAALLARTPPAQWADPDRDVFSVALGRTAGAFHRLEPLALDLASDDGDTGAAPSAVRRVRLSVQTLSESERDGVVHVHPEDDDLVERLRESLAETARQSGAGADVQLAALSELVSDLLAQRTSAPARP